MRDEAWTEAKIVLTDYPRYDWYLKRMEYELKYPYRETDTNTGGSSGTRNPDPLGSDVANRIVKLDDSIVYNRVKAQKEAVELTFDQCPEWVEGMIELMYFVQNTLPMYKVAELLGRDRKTAKKYYNDFMERLAGNLGLIRDWGRY